MLWLWNSPIVEFPDLQESGPDIAAETDIIYRALVDDRLRWHVSSEAKLENNWGHYVKSKGSKLYAAFFIADPLSLLPPSFLVYARFARNFPPLFPPPYSLSFPPSRAGKREECGAIDDIVDNY
eukprot:scaffold4298_cov166-Skeletonema_marinoi.AAC.8